MIRGTIRLAALFTALALAASAPAGDRADDLLARKLGEFHGAERGRISPVTDPSITTLFPPYHFYVLRFRQYPVAIDPPEPLAATNLFVVKPDDTVEHLRDVHDLERFFRAALPPLTTTDQARMATRAWLRLVEEFHQDGFFRFSISDDSLRVDAGPGGVRHTTGKATVSHDGGNGGEITASLAFDEHGRLVNATTAARLKNGMRPICQATKLLDPDPIVRRMAEQDLFVMGESAREYLDEQRAKADPELRAAIDRIWQRIVRSGE